METNAEIDFKNYSNKILPPAIFEIKDNKTAYCVVNKSIRDLLSRSQGKPVITSISDLPFVSVLTNKKKIAKLRLRLLKILKTPKINKEYTDDQLTKLPGPQPITITRNRLQDLVQNKFWVSEKSDGERCVLLIRKKSSYLVNRSFDFFVLNDSFYSKNLYRNGESILDGELVFKTLGVANAGYEFLKARYVFLIFDIVKVFGETVFESALSARFAHIRNFNAHYRQTALSKQPHPLAVLSKIFIDIRRLDELCAQVHFDAARNEYVFFDKKKGVGNGNDGFIFTPESDGFLQRKRMLFKWKWLEMNTFDLRIESPLFGPKKAEMDVFCKGDDSASLLVQKLGPFRAEDRALLQRALAQAPKKVFCIVEVGAKLNRRGQREWVVHKVRTDRDRANHVSTVVRTMEVLLENVTLVEIKRVLAESKFLT